MNFNFVWQAGHSVHIGGLVRLDIEELSVDSVYLTVWASHLLPLHMGRTENTCTMIEEHFGRQLQVKSSLPSAAFGLGFLYQLWKLVWNKSSKFISLHS